jgi:glycosyltransferase involved in cell wall biosynthesis
MAISTNGSLANGAKKPVVCQLLHTLNVGGAEVLAARLARQLRADCQFLFVCLDELGTLGGELREEGFPVEVLGRRAGIDWRCTWHLARLLRRAHVDVVHAHQYTPFFYAMAARLLYRRPPVLFTEHGRHFPDHPRRKRMLVNRLLLERRDRVIGVGGAVRDALILNEGIPAPRVQVIYNGIDTAAFSNGYHEHEPIRRELGVGPRDFVLLQVARLDYLKDHATAIRTMQRLVPRMPNVRLVLVGEGPERGKTQALIDQYQLGAHVRFLGLRKDVARLLRVADLFLLTSISEGIPLTVIEAMAAGVPVVSTRVGGLPEVVEDGVTGALVDAGDDAALAERIWSLAHDTALHQRMGRHGRERAGALFSEAQMHGQYLHLYREMRNARSGMTSSLAKAAM